MSEARAILVLSLFIGGLVGGVVLERIVNTSGVRESPYATLDKVEEPGVSAEVAAAIETTDSRRLARLMGAQQLQALRQALMSPLDRPIADVRGVKFAGATARGTRVVAAYILSGKDMGGTDSIVGFVLDVENGQIVGVND